MLTLNPTRGMVAIKRKDAETEKNGIALPDAAQETPHEGTIIYVSEQSVFTVGQEAIFGRYAGTEIDDEGQILNLLDDSAVLCVREKPV